MVTYATDFNQSGDVVSAGGWLIRASRRFPTVAKDLVTEHIPRLESAACAGNPEAKAMLAGLLLERKIDPPRAATLFEEASQSEVPEGKRGLGHMLCAGIVFERDYGRGVDLFRQGIALGDGYCALNLAMCFGEGKGVARNANSFLQWMRVAAELCVHEACLLLAEALDRQRKYHEAWEWYLKAAELGNIASCFVAARRYRDGQDPAPANPVQAVRWFLAPLDSGVVDGLRSIAEMVSTIGIEQLREAGYLAHHEREAQMLVDRFFPSGD